MATATVNAHLTEAACPNAATVEMHIDNLPKGQTAPADGSITAAKLAASAVETAKIKDGAVTAPKLAAGVLPTNATASKAGLVKQAAAVAPMAAADAAPAAAETVTKAEFDKVVAVANEAKKQVNALIAAGKAAGWLAQG